MGKGLVCDGTAKRRHHDTVSTEPPPQTASTSPHQIPGVTSPTDGQDGVRCVIRICDQKLFIKRVFGPGLLPAIKSVESC